MAVVPVSFKLVNVVLPETAATEVAPPRIAPEEATSIESVVSTVLPETSWKTTCG